MIHVYVYVYVYVLRIMYYVLCIMYYVLCIMYYVYIYTHTCAVVQLHRINVGWSSINENSDIMGMYQSLLMD